MAVKSAIEWTDATWNPIRGCTRVSEGCRNCYAEKVAHRFNGFRQPYEGLTSIVNGKPIWNGTIKFVAEHLLDPIRWKEPRRIFVNSMSDLFHENVTGNMLDDIFAVMALCPQHMFQILTKRPAQMLAYFNAKRPNNMSSDACQLTPWYVWRSVNMIQAKLRPGSTTCPIGWNLEDEARDSVAAFNGWPLPNVWIGVSVEDQDTANKRIPLLLKTPAAKRFISAEPLLGPVDLGHGLADGLPVFRTFKARAFSGLTGQDMGPVPDGWYRHHGNIHPWLDWVIVGGESGPGARPMHPQWAGSLRDQCIAARVPFFFKQWGEWGQVPRQWVTDTLSPQMVQIGDVLITSGGESDVLGKDLRSNYEAECAPMRRLGKKAAGRLLDGREWNEMPA